MLGSALGQYGVRAQPTALTRFGQSLHSMYLFINHLRHGFR